MQSKRQSVPNAPARLRLYRTFTDYQLQHHQNSMFLTNDLISNYHHVAISLHQRLTKGFQFDISYTFSHALDMLSGGSFDNGIAADIHNLNLNYGNSDSDSRNRLTLSATYNIPGIKAPLQMLRGWSVSPIVAARLIGPLRFL